MLVAAVVCVCLPAVLGASGPWLARNLSGRAASILLTVSALVSSVSAGLVLCAIACLSLAQVKPFAAQGRWSAIAVASRDPVPTSVAVVCGVIAAALLVSAAVRVLTSGRRLARSARACRGLDTSGNGLIVVDDPSPHAFAVPGFPGSIVISRAMLRSLSADERRVLLAHEGAHVRHHHYLYVQLTALAAAANPLLLPLRRAVRIGVERWADDIAAVDVADRGLVAVTLARAALSRVSSPATIPAGALGAAVSDIRQRVDALLVVRSRVLGTAAVMVLLAVILGCVASSGFVALWSHELLEWAQLLTPGRVPRAS